MRYFDHDTHAADDDAIMALRMTHGGAAVDCYWTLLEKMYRDEAPVELFGTKAETDAETESVSRLVPNAETMSVTHRLCIGSDVLEKYVSSMLDLGLLKGTLEKVHSERALENIKEYQEKCKKARQNGKAGGRKPKPKPTRKPTAKNAETDAETESVARKEKKSIGLDKLNQYQYGTSDGAADACASPPSVQCPTCDAPMRLTDSHKGDKRLWRCELCAEEVWL